MVAMANPRTEADLVRLGRWFAAGASQGGQVLGIHFVRVPRQTPLSVARARFTEQREIQDTIVRAGHDVSSGGAGSHDPVRDTSIEAVTDVAHDVFAGLLDETHRRRADLLVAGWEGGFTVGRIYHSPVQRIMAGLEADLAVLKDRGLDNLQRILVPWGGGVHAKLGLELAVRVARAVGGTVEVVRVVRPDVDRDTEEQALASGITSITGSVVHVHSRVRPAEDVSSGIQRTLAEDGPFDLVIIGASRESRLRNVLFGSIPDIVADQADCSVLMVHRYVPGHWTYRVTERFKRLRELAGLTTSPEESSSPLGDSPASGHDGQGRSR